MIEMQRNVCNGHGMTIKSAYYSAPCRKRFELRHNSLAPLHRRGMQAESITDVANGDPAIQLARGGSFGSPRRYRRAENQLLWAEPSTMAASLSTNCEKPGPQEPASPTRIAGCHSLLAKTPPIELLTRCAQSLATGMATLQTLMMRDNFIICGNACRERVASARNGWLQAELGIRVGHFPIATFDATTSEWKVTSARFPSQANCPARSVAGESHRPTST